MSLPFPPTPLRRGHAQTVRDSSSRYKIEYVIVIKNFLNPEGHQNPISGSKVTVFLLKGLIWPIGGVASERVCACSLRSRLVLIRFPTSLLRYFISHESTTLMHLLDVFFRCDNTLLQCKTLWLASSLARSLTLFSQLVTDRRLNS